MKSRRIWQFGNEMNKVEYFSWKLLRTDIYKEDTRHSMAFNNNTFKTVKFPS